MLGLTLSREVACPPRTDPDVVLALKQINTKEKVMGRKINSPEQIVRKLRQAEVLISQGNTISQASRQLGITEQTYYRWRKLYGGMQVSQAKRLKELENENTRLKKLVADLSLDKAILKEAAKGNF